MDPRLRALNRFGLGARIGERDTISDPRGWLRAQLEATNGALPPDADVPTFEEIGGAILALRSAQRSRNREDVQAARRALNRIGARETRAMLTRRITTPTPFVERLVAFWSNHLCISVGNVTVSALAGDYERQIVRRNVLGRFEDMVLASARHPAMLLYLDNAQSIGPGSPAARNAAQRGRRRGLNENYARELLELHTLGVDGGYAQHDVQDLARVLSGWTVSSLGPGARAGDPVGFAFRHELHEPGAKTVLGTRYPESGMHEGERVIGDLCAHPATASFIAGKLVRHFVSDDPPAEAVESLAGTFRETRGDLRAVALALVDLEEAWAPEHSKFRTPQDWLVAVLRAFGLNRAPQNMDRLLRQLRHRPWAPTAPKGYGDLEREWADPDALMNRAELARSLAERLGRRRDPARIVEVIEVAPDDRLPGFLSDESIAPQERVAIALGGPAFQWR